MNPETTIKILLFATRRASQEKTQSLFQSFRKYYKIRAIVKKRTPIVSFYYWLLKKHIQEFREEEVRDTMDQFFYNPIKFFEAYEKQARINHRSAFLFNRFKKRVLNLKRHSLQNNIETETDQDTSNSELWPKGLTLTNH